jgi:hypothetical protein
VEARWTQVRAGRAPVVVVIETEAPELAEVRAAQPELEDL